MPVSAINGSVNGPVRSDNLDQRFKDAIEKKDYDTMTRLLQTQGLAPGKREDTSMMQTLSDGNRWNAKPRELADTLSGISKVPARGDKTAAEAGLCINRNNPELYKKVMAELKTSDSNLYDSDLPPFSDHYELENSSTQSC